MRALLVIVFMARVAAASPELDAVIKQAPGCDANRKQCFGLALHVAIDNSKPIATADWMTAQLAGANRHFEALDTEFKIVSIDALPASALRVEDRKERDSFASLATGRVIHVFVT